MKKFELTENFKINAFGVKLFQIKAVRSFASVSEGELGGYVEKEENLDHDGDAWVYGNAEVYGDARVYGNAEVYGDARVYGDAWVYGNAEVYGDARVYGNADYLLFRGFGSANRVTTAFRTKDGGVAVKCGCFYGTLTEFAEKVSEVHGDTLYGREYRAVIEAIKIHFGIK